MSKSPLNFGFMTSAARTIKTRGRNARIKKLENQMQTIMRDRNKNYDMGADMNNPEFATATESQPGSLQAPAQEDMLTPINSFSPETLGAANKMFGTEVPGSFDRDMGGSPLNRGHKKLTADGPMIPENEKEKPLTDEEKKRLHAVSSINYDKVVASGGVDLGIIKNKKKNKDETPLNRHKAGHKISKWRQMENEKFEAEKAAHKAEKARLLELTRKRREKIYGTDQSSWGK